MPPASRRDPPALRARVTLSDVARYVGVSVSVVSRELNGDPALRARPETRRRIHAAAKTLGYAPNHAARSLRLSRAFAIGVIVPELTNAIYDGLVRGIEDRKISAALMASIARALYDEATGSGSVVASRHRP